MRRPSHRDRRHTRPLEAMLFLVERLDDPAVGAAIALLFTTALVACYLPARRATQVDPVTALRAD